MSTDRLLGALFRWELDRQLTRRGLVPALVLFAGVRALGAATDAGLAAEAYFLGLIGVMQYGLSTDRRCGLDAYLVRNHVRPRAYLAGKVLAMLAMIGAFGAFAAGAEAVLTGDPGTAVWMATALTLAGLMAAPIAMAIEAHADTSMPAALVILPWTIGAVLVFVTTGSLVVLEVVGLAALEPGVWSSLAGAAWRAAVWIPLGFLGAGAVARLSLPRY